MFFLYLADTGKELGLLMQNGLNMKYYFETIRLPLHRKMGYTVTLRRFPKVKLYSWNM